MLNIIQSLCPPAFLYLMFSLANVVFDLFNGMYNAAMVRSITATLITTALNFLCSKNMSIISWFIVFLPFLLMTYLVGILLFTLGLDPTTGPIDIEYPRTVDPTEEVMVDPRVQAARDNALNDVQNNSVETTEETQEENVEETTESDRTLFEKLIHVIDTHKAEEEANTQQETSESESFTLTVNKQNLLSYDDNETNYASF